MSKAQWNNGFYKGMDKGEKIGCNIQEAIESQDFMRALCLATAVKDQMEKDTVSKHVLMDMLLDFLGEKCGGRIDEKTSTISIDENF